MSERCPTCLAPVAHCFCAQVPRVAARLPIVLVRHVSERRKVSNTGGLVARVLGARLLDHGGVESPVSLGDLGGAPHLLFPGGRTGDWPAPSTLVVLDGTWSQVRAMRARVPGVAGLPVLSLPAAVPRDRMRAQHRPDGVSTLEAVAAALERLGDPEPAAALREVFAVMTATWLGMRQRAEPTAASA